MLNTLKTALIKTKFGQRIKDEYAYHIYYKNYKYMRKLITYKSPEAGIRYLWNRYMNYPLNLDAPRSFNEKLQWLKLNWYDETARTCANKYKVREYVKSVGLGDLLIDLIMVYRSPAEIVWSELPQKFVLKPSHDSGHTIICIDKDSLVEKQVKRKLQRWLDVDYQYVGGEWPYASEKYIICEKFMESPDGQGLTDYKFMCFNGEPRMLFTCIDRFSENGLKVNFYDLEWNLLPFERYYPRSQRSIPKPKKFNDMIEYAKVLAKPFPFVRVDLYELNDRIYFGELTFFPGGGVECFKPESADFEVGSLLTLPQKSDPWGILLSEKDAQK